MQPKRIQTFIWDSSRDFLCGSYKWQATVTVTRNILGRDGFGKVYKGRLARWNSCCCQETEGGSWKGLLKEKKLEMLVDPDLQTNYEERSITGDGLAEKWDEWQKVKILREENDLSPNPHSDWIVDST
ncbi:hypothetical protein YC2023_016675 [Brassica napus]